MGLIPLMDLHLQNMPVLFQGPVLFRRLILQNLKLILQYLDPFFELGQILRRILY